MDYVIVGAGPAGVTAAETLRKQDPQGAVTLLGDEPEPPYSRMAIPYLLTGKIDEGGTHLRPGEGRWDGIYRQAGVKGVNVGARTLSLTDGADLRYDRLLIATGARPVRPPIEGLNLPAVHHCWTLKDARNIIDLAKPGSHVVLLGAGFIGCIIMEALAERDVQLTVIEMGDRMVPRMMNPAAGSMLSRWVESKGVNVRTSTRITKIEPAADVKKKGGILSWFGLGGKKEPAASDDALVVDLDNGEQIPAHLVVVAAGVTPNVEFLEGSGVEVGDGIVIDDHFRSSVDGIYGAGDVVQGRDFSTGGKAVHAIQPTATEHGRIAALNMSGSDVAYPGSLQMNVLDTLGLISSSFGAWQGVDGGTSAERIDEANYLYVNLQFADDVLVGACSVGFTQHVGVLRGLIQSKVRLGDWKAKLEDNPLRVMEAYLARVQG